MIKSVVITAARALGIGAVAVGASVAGFAAPAHAVSTDGKVISTSGVTVRTAPSTHAGAKAAIADNKVFPISCKVRGTMVDGNDIWYALPPTTNEWVSARYVRNVGPVPDWCSDDSVRTVGTTTVVLTTRKGPTTADASKGTLARGAKVSVVCKVSSQSVSGNKLWYHTTDSRWVSARYVSNVGAAPGYCVED